MISLFIPIMHPHIYLSICYAVRLHVFVYTKHTAMQTVLSFSTLRIEFVWGKLNSRSKIKEISIHIFHCFSLSSSSFGAFVNVYHIVRFFFFELLLSVCVRAQGRTFNYLFEYIRHSNTYVMYAQKTHTMQACTVHKNVSTKENATRRRMFNGSRRFVCFQCRKNQNEMEFYKKRRTKHTHR